MSGQPMTMIDATGNEFVVTSYDEASRVMASFQDKAQRLATILNGDLEMAKKLMPEALKLQRRYDENVRVYQYFVAHADIRNTAAAMTHIAEQTKALREKSG